MGKAHVKEVLQGFLAKLYAQRQTLASELQLLDQQIVEVTMTLNEINAARWDVSPANNSQEPSE